MSRSASAQTICGSLPPSSSTAPLSARPQVSPTLRPTSTEPVKKIFAVDASQSAAPIWPPPWTVRTRPSGTPAVLERPADPLAEQRRQARRLEDDAVAGHQRDRDLAERDRPRVVPRRDHADHAERLVGEVGALRAQEGLRSSGPARRRAASGPRRRTSAGRRSSAAAPSSGSRSIGLPCSRVSSSATSSSCSTSASAVRTCSGRGRRRELGPERLQLRDLVDDPLDLVRGDRLDRADELAGGRVEGLELTHPSDPTLRPRVFAYCPRCATELEPRREAARGPAAADLPGLRLRPLREPGAHGASLDRARRALPLPAPRARAAARQVEPDRGLPRAVRVAAGRDQARGAARSSASRSRSAS